MSQKDPEDWFLEVSDVKTYKKVNPVIPGGQVLYFRQIALQIRREFISQCHERIYTGGIRGSRTSRVKRVVKNVHYWLNRWAAMEDRHMAVNMYRNGKDVYGNEFRDYMVDFTNYRFDYPLNLHPLDGRMLFQVRTELRPELKMSRIKRWLIERFPKLFNPLKMKYVTNFVVVIKIWVDVLHHFDLDVYKIQVHDNIIPPKEEHFREDRDEYDVRKRYFQSRKSVSRI